MFLGHSFKQDDPDLEGPPRPNFMDRLSSGLKDPRRQAFLQASLDLMRAGGYSDRPVSLPQALGAAGTRGLNTYRDAMRQQAEQARVAQQRKDKEAAIKRARDEQIYQHRLDAQKR